MELFITYQIPSDLLSFGGDANAPKLEKLNKVKSHVQGTIFLELKLLQLCSFQAMQTMIHTERLKQLTEGRNEAMMRGLEGSSAIVSNARFGASPSSVEFGHQTGSLASGSVNVTKQPGNNKGDKKLSLARGVDDYTQLPVEMDRKFEALDVDGMLNSLSNRCCCSVICCVDCCS